MTPFEKLKQTVAPYCDLEDKSGKVMAIKTISEMPLDFYVSQFDYLTSNGFKLDLVTGIYHRVD